MKTIVTQKDLDNAVIFCSREADPVATKAAIIEAGHRLNLRLPDAWSEVHFEEARDKNGKWTTGGGGSASDNHKTDRLNGIRSVQEKQDGVWLNRHICPHCGAQGHEKVIVGDDNDVKCKKCDTSKSPYSATPLHIAAKTARDKADAAVDDYDDALDNDESSDVIGYHVAKVKATHKAANAAEKKAGLDRRGLGRRLNS